jgi:hypothetical protein
LGRCASYLALGQERLDFRPGLTLCGVAEEVHDNGAFPDSFLDFKEICPRYPAILLCFLPGCAILPDPDDDIEAIVP